MLRQISELPTDKRIAGAHILPVTEDGSIVMCWNHEECLLTTIGGRIEAGESIEQALQREAREEAGITLAGPYEPFASWYWESTDTYTVWYHGRLAGYTDMLPGFETTGRVVCSIETARELIRHLHDPSAEIRLALLDLAQKGGCR